MPFLGGLIIHKTFRFSCFIMHKKEAHMVDIMIYFIKGERSPGERDRERGGPGERESVTGSHNNYSITV